MEGARCIVRLEPSPAPAIIILAAGRSSRMGAMKLLLPLGGRPVIAHVVAAALDTWLRPVVVVIGHHAAQMRHALSYLDVLVVENDRFGDGQSTSLHAALAVMPPGATGAIVMLGDQPLVTAADIKRLADAAIGNPAPIIAASYNGQRGNPVYFARVCFPELLNVTGDTGGREVIARHLSDLSLVEMDDPTAALDIDDAESYARVRTWWDQRNQTS